MNKFFLPAFFAMVATLSANAQSLEKMQWFNDPESYTTNNHIIE